MSEAPPWRRVAGAAAAWVYPGASGPAVAQAFSRLYALVLVAAWASLAVQVRELIGERGLLPLRPLLQMARAAGDFPLMHFPSLLRWPGLAGDGVLLAGTLLGVALGLCAFVGGRPRLCFALSTVLYLSYATACREFLAFQWDNLLIECGLLAVLLPVDRPAPLVHLLLRVVIFKLYFQSGLAKWGSSIGDWRDGSAMLLYYETAPLPSWLGFFAHNLPDAWHRAESAIVLIGELLVPWFLFGPRRLRLLAAVVLSLFQLVNLATANYGFFCYLSLALHVFALDDRDVAGPLDWLRSRVGPRFLPPPLATPPRPLPIVAHAALITFFVLHLGISLVEGLERFGRPGAWQAALLPVSRTYAPLRVVNTYHLFASVTRERVEPQIEVQLDGAPTQWQPLHLRYKPGDPGRRPAFVAPHQPRLDFRLWFHGLSWQRRPEYLANLLSHLCHDRAAVAGLFARPPPTGIRSVRVSYLDYRFTSVQQWRATRQWWSTALVATSPEVSCDR